MSKVYLVIFDGNMGDYGSYTYLLGAYDTKDKAEEFAIDRMVVSEWRYECNGMECSRWYIDEI